jgi:hypothetical protein
MLVAHIAGLPVEETVLGLAPIGAAGLGGLLAYGAQRTRRWRRPRPRVTRRRGGSSKSGGTAADGRSDCSGVS